MEKDMKYFYIHIYMCASVCRNAINQEKERKLILKDRTDGTVGFYMYCKSHCIK